MVKLHIDWVIHRQQVWGRFKEWLRWRHWATFWVHWLWQLWNKTFVLHCYTNIFCLSAESINLVSGFSKRNTFDFSEGSFCLCQNRAKTVFCVIISLDDVSQKSFGSKPKLTKALVQRDWLLKELRNPAYSFFSKLWNYYLMSRTLLLRETYFTGGNAEIYVETHILYCLCAKNKYTSKGNW